jgi:hypothetical protein
MSRRRIPLATPSAAGREREDELLEWLCALLSLAESYDVRVVARPDREVPGHSDCDALISRTDGTWAVEHTRIHSVKGLPGHLHRLDALRAMVCPAVLRLRPTDLTWAAIHVTDLPARSQLDTIADELTQCIAETVSTLDLRIWHEAQTSETKRRVRVCRLRANARGMCVLSPLEPPEGQWDDEVDRAIRENVGKLISRKLGGSRTLLLLDAEEVGWPGGHDTIAAVERAMARIELGAVDEVLLAGTAMMPAVPIYLKRGEMMGREACRCGPIEAAEHVLLRDAQEWPESSRG